MRTQPSILRCDIEMFSSSAEAMKVNIQIVLACGFIVACLHTCLTTDLELSVPVALLPRYGDFGIYL